MSINLPKRHRFDLLWELIKTNFKMRYQNSILGILWVIIKPYAIFLVLFSIWSSVQNTSQINDYPSYLLIGLITYTYFQELVLFGQNSLLERAGIILKVNFPRQIAIISSLTGALINLGINIVLVFIITLSRGLRPSLAGILYYLLIVLTLFIFGLGISFFLSTLTIRLRDLKNVLDLGLFLLFWLTPIVYAVNKTTLDENTFSFVQINPLTNILNQSRAAFGVYEAMDITKILPFLIVSLIITFFGWRHFNSHVKRIAEYF